MKGYHIIYKDGTIAYRGPLNETKSDHSNMPPRTDAYLDTDERGHLLASSLGGTNKSENILPQSKDLNRGPYRSVELGETASLKAGVQIESEKMAFCSRPGARPDTFIVNDTLTNPENGHTETLNFSFPNLTEEELETFESEEMDDSWDEFPNPGDTLRDMMSLEEYAKLMDSIDAEMPEDIADEYASAVRAVSVPDAQKDIQDNSKDKNETEETQGGHGRGGQ